MVRKSNAPVPSHPRPIHFPLHHIITEVEAFAALRNEIQTFRNENQLLPDDLATLEEESRAHDPSPLPVPTPEPPDSSTLLPPMSFRKSKINLSPEFDSKVSEYVTFLNHCEFYFDNKPSMFFNNDKNKVSVVIFQLRGRAVT